MEDVNTPKMAIAKRLRVAREQSGLTQGQVAKLMNWHRPTVSQLEAGERRLSADELPKLAAHYGVSVSWLTRTIDLDEDPMDPQLELAAKELSRLKPDDLQRVIKLLSAIRSQGASDGGDAR